MHKDFFPFKSSKVHFSCWGTGPFAFFCFHGYGESGASFACLSEDLLPPEYTMIALDLPYHGQTDWKDERLFSVEDLVAIMEGILRGLQIKPKEMVLLGYSLGGRIALSLLEKIPQKIHKLILLAPDGLKMNLWYRIAIQTYAGNKLFRFTMKHPVWFLALLEMGQWTRIIPKREYAFNSYYVRDQQSRDELYLRWTILREFQPHLDKIKIILREKHIGVTLFLGQFDQIFRPESGKKFQKGLETQCELVILPCGHQVLQENNAETIIRCLKE